jgi:hypothetical protein
LKDSLKDYQNMNNWQWTKGKLIAMGITFSAILYICKEKEINEAVQKLAEWFIEKEERKEALVAVTNMLRREIIDHFKKFK